MDCRLSFFLAFGVAWGCGGCVGADKRLAPPAEPPPHLVKKEASGPKRAPKASTMTAWAACKAAEADKPDLPAADQEKLRDEARKAFQQALQIDPQYVPAFQGLAKLNVDMGDFNRALEIYRKALDKHPKAAALWFDLGICLGRTKDFDQAIRCLRAAAELEPEDRRLHKTLAVFLARAGRFDEGVACLLNVESPAQAHLHAAQMALYLQRKGHLAAESANNLCRRHLQAALHHDPRLAEARALLAQLEGDPEFEAVLDPSGAVPFVK